MSKYLNIILAIIIATIVVLIINARRKEHLLKQDYDRLTAKYGALDVEDNVKGPGNRASPGSNGVMLWISSDEVEGDQ